MGKLMQEFLEKEKALELSKEIEVAALETSLSINAATRLIAEQYKKNHLHSDQTNEDDNEKILNDILTDKLEIDNYGVYENDGQTIRRLDEV